VLAIEREVRLPIEQAEVAVRAALAEQGFGVLTEIDVSTVLREKLGVERPPMKILGACNPHFAERALEIDPSTSLLLPCNVVLQEVGAGTHIAAVDPRALMDHPQFHDLSAEAASRLEAALATVAGG
jgi:uncharacterized protein (DUF302 family)